jgi:ABC-type multidrug transport system ATPase subunit
MMRLVAEGVRFRYRSGREVGPLDLDVSGGVVWLHGGNGSGKTTLLRCLCGEYVPTSGTVRVGGRDPAVVADARRHVALFTATPEIPDFLTVDEAWQQIAALRGRPRWDGAALRETLGLDGRLRLGQASAGQRRLAELLCAAAGDPEILLLDEVFANLDVGVSARLVDLLTTWRTSRTLIVTTHQPLLLSPDQTLDLSGVGEPPT